MTEQIDGTPDHEQPETEAVGLRRVQAVERLKHRRELVGRHADAGVMDLDAQLRAAPSAPDEDAPVPVRVFQGVAGEVAHNSLQQDFIAYDGRLRRNDVQPHVFLVGQVALIAL